MNLRIDELLPECQFAEHHELVVAAAPDVTYRALWEADFAASPIVRALIALRAVPTRLFGRLPSRPARLTLREVLRTGFRLLAEEPGHELVLGITGRFWRLAWELDRPGADDFASAPPPGTARAAINFVVTAEGRGSTRLSTETRVFCSDESSLRSFRRYWMVVRPFSGWIRTRMLCSIRAVAERSAPAA